jgi:hypothetical protein
MPIRLLESVYFVERSMDLWSESLQASAKIQGNRHTVTARAVETVASLPCSPLSSPISLSLQATDKATHWAALTLKEREETPYADFCPASPGQGEVLTQPLHSSALI